MTIYIAFGPEDATETHNKYWLALGKFIHNFAQLEASAFLLLREKAGLTQDVAGALLSGTKAEQAFNLLKRLYDAKGDEISESAQRALIQFGLINKARNEIVHHAPDLESGDFTVSNRRKNIQSRAFIKEFTPEILEQMTNDVRTIYAAIHVWHIGPNAQAWDRHGRNWGELALAPWQYKENAQKQNPGKSQSSRRKHAAPPQSLQG